MRALVNIGMWKAHGEVLRPSEIQSTLDNFTVEEFAHRITKQHETDELTYVALVDGWTDDKAMVIAKALDQDCIAQYDLDACEGKLVGPRTAQWGNFEPMLFQVL